MNEQNRKLLTRVELEQITGFVQPRKQCERLRENGIFFIVRKDGRPSTTWGHIEYPLSSRQLIQVASDEQPDYDAI